MTKDQFKKLKLGETVISNIVPTIEYVISKKCKNYYIVTHSEIMSKHEAWDLVKSKTNDDKKS